jgi:hypothetical protein
MGDEVDWKALREERTALVERIRAEPIEVAWRDVRAALEESPSISTGRQILTVYEGPIRTFLLPLPYELLQDFVERRGASAADWVFAHAGDGAERGGGSVRPYGTDVGARVMHPALKCWASFVRSLRDEEGCCCGAWDWGALALVGLIACGMQRRRRVHRA